MEQNSQWINWYNFLCVNDTFMVKTVPDTTKLESTGGILLEAEVSKLQDRPSYGEIMSVGNNTIYNVGDYVYFEPTKGMDLGMIKTTGDERYLLLYDDAVVGIRVKDSRDIDGDWVLEQAVKGLI